MLTYEEALRHKLHTEWDDHHIAVPEFIGRQSLEGFSARRSWCRISTGRRSFIPGRCAGAIRICSTIRLAVPAARELFANAQELLKEIVDKKLFTAHAVYGFYPANSDGDDIVVYSDVTRTKELARLHTLRQQKDNQRGKPQLALADFIAPRDERAGRLHRRICRYDGSWLPGSGRAL